MWSVSASSTLTLTLVLPLNPNPNPNPNPNQVGFGIFHAGYGPDNFAPFARAFADWPK